MTWGRDGSRKLVKGYSAMDVERKVKEHIQRGWRQISEIQTTNFNGGAYAALMKQTKK